MTDSEDPLMSLDELVDEYELSDHLHSLADLPGEVQEGAAASPPPEPRVRWKKRDRDGNVLSVRPRSSRNQSNQGQFFFQSRYFHDLI